MTTFYEELADGRSKADALRKAKLAYLDQADDLMAAPAYWAGLVLVGDAQPLVPPRARAVWPLWAGLAAATAVLAGGAAWLGRRRLYSSSSSRRARSV